jgi:hypothetical protein
METVLTRHTVVNGYDNDMRTKKSLAQTQPPQNKHQLDLLLQIICLILQTEARRCFEMNGKLLRDILDPIEGLGRGILSKKGTYSHSALKSGCCLISESAQHGPSSKLHREHAIPLKVIIQELRRHSKKSCFTPETLGKFIASYCVSVLVTAKEKTLLDSSAKSGCRMPEGWKLGKHRFARLKKASVSIRPRRDRKPKWQPLFT